MIKILEVTDAVQKSQKTAKILSDLPEWFGDEKGLKAYVEGVKTTSS